MKGILEIKGLPKGFKVNGVKIEEKFEIKNLEKVMDLNIQKGQIIRIKDIGSFRVTLALKGSERYWIDIE